MSFTRAEKRQLSLLWHGLAEAAIARDGPELAALSQRALVWASPSDRPGSAYVLFALARLAVAHARGTTVDQARLGPALSETALLAQEILAAVAIADGHPADGVRPWWTEG